MRTGRSSKNFWRLIATRTFCERVGVIILALGYMVVYCPAVLALTGDTPEQLYEIQTGTTDYDPNSNCTTGGSDASDAGGPAININLAAAEGIAQQSSKGAANVGFSLYNADGKDEGSYNDTFETYGASITKAMILVAYLNQVGTGTIDPTASKWLTGMIEQSNDADADDVFDLLNNPQTQIQAVATAAGMTNFKFNDTGDSLYVLGQSQITAQDFALFFSKISNMFPGPQEDFALQLLSTITPNAGLLKANLPGTIYSKEGWKPEPGGGTDPASSGSANPFGNEGAPYIVNQAAQFSSNGVTYGLAITVSGTASETSGETIIANVASALITTTGGSTSSTDSCSCNGGDSGNNIGKVGTVDWQSSAKPPYYLEEFIVNILQALAATTNHPTSDAVTKEHVLAMTAWAYAEGGNIANTDIYNVWNTGIGSVSQYAYLVQGGSSQSGVESFKSFDYGVDAMVISVTQPSQTRIGSILLNPDSTAQQVIDAIADYQDYKNNLEWATNPDYLNSLNTMLNQANQDYAQEASVEIGPGEEGQDHVPTSKLQYAGDTSTGGTPTGTDQGTSTETACLSSDTIGNCPTNGQAGTTGDATILACAEQYNGIYYQYGGGHIDYAAFRQGCPLSQLAGAPKSPAASASTPGDTGACATDCSGLVSMSLDQAFNLNDNMIVSADGVMEGTGASDWKAISIADAKPGDIVTHGNGDGHVEIVESVKGDNLMTFGSHETGTQTSEVPSTADYWVAAYEWTGTGSQGGTTTTTTTTGGYHGPISGK